MEAFLKLLVALSIFACGSTSDWPLMRCSRNDPDIERCLLKAARQSVLKVFNGIPLFDLPPIEPMKLGNTDLSVKKGPVNLQISFENAYLIGASKIRIDSAKYRKDIQRLNIGGYHEDIKLRAKYSMKGKILLFPVTSEGTLEIDFENVQADHLIQFTPRSNVGLSVQPKQRPLVQFNLDMKSIGLMRFNLTANGFGSFANRALNEVVNSNWRLLYNAFKPSVEDWLHNVYSKTMNSFFVKFDFDEILPERLP